MINIEILSSSDSNAIGSYDFQYDEIYIGRSKKNDLIFLDKELPMNFMALQIIEEATGIYLIARSFTRSPFFFINGKKISGVLKIYPNDVIAFGENQIKITSFKQTKVEEDLAFAFENFSKKAPELRFALDFIEEVLIEAETKGKHV